MEKHQRHPVLLEEQTQSDDCWLCRRLKGLESSDSEHAGIRLSQVQYSCISCTVSVSDHHYERPVWIAHSNS